MATGTVSDEVWQSFDPSTGMLSRRTGRAIAVLYALGLAVVTLVLIARHEGLISPLNYADPVSAGAVNDSGGRHVHLVIAIHNLNRVDEHVTAVFAAASGATQTSPTAVDLTIPRHGSAHVAIDLRADDCSRIRRDRLSLHIVTEHFWGHYTQGLRWPLAFPDGLGDACRLPPR